MRSEAARNPSRCPARTAAWLSRCRRGDDGCAVAAPGCRPNQGRSAHHPGGNERWPRIEGDLSAIERLNDGYRRIRRELAKVIVGQERVIEEMLIAIFARGHCLLVGVPGLAKTLLIRTLAESLNLSSAASSSRPT